MGHTPGPWYANQDCIEIDGPEGPRDVTLAVVMQPTNAAADARLIALAPELLAMLRRGSDAVSALEADCDMAGLDCYPARHWWQDADRLIAKAEGRE